MSKPLCIVVGFGAGIGAGVAKAFGAAGFRTGLIARNPAKQQAALDELAATGVEFQTAAADAGDAASLQGAIAQLLTAGAAEVLVYNAVAPTFAKPTQLSAEQLVADFQVNVAGALVASKAVLPGMVASGRGSILFTGGGWAHQPWDQASSISIGKAGLRTLGLTLAQELADSPIKLGLLTVLGQVAPGTAFDPGRIGQAFLALHRTEKAAMQAETMFTGG